MVPSISLIPHSLKISLEGSYSGSANSLGTQAPCIVALCFTILVHCFHLQVCLMIQHGCWELHPLHSHSRQHEEGTKEGQKEYAHPLPFQKSHTTALLTSQGPRLSHAAAPDCRGGCGFMERENEDC